MPCFYLKLKQKRTDIAGVIRVADSSCIAPSVGNVVRPRAKERHAITNLIAQPCNPLYDRKT